MYTINQKSSYYKKTKQNKTDELKGGYDATIRYR